MFYSKLCKIAALKCQALELSSSINFQKVQEFLASLFMGSFRHGISKGVTLKLVVYGPRIKFLYHDRDGAFLYIKAITAKK